ncbi:glycosyltransferase [Paenibacillus oleatilyticus]|uniref:glycosyltransferase n=1 Tax=Paenibacillus oleatilyticus TaxID=2594886 RepID=UPI001C1FFB7F|nr:glycosyltransferase [Paenibacillus oleatilyticus]MBU7319743.1 glycosyltransferase [Paenibacillus oleatilyticus]
MKVSVVIPCYNHGKYVEEAIKSVLASTYENIEIIVVNDGSTCEDTVNILNDLEKKYEDIVFIHQSNKGLPGARNSGIRVSTGEYILPLDADDLIAPTFIEKAVWVLIRKPEISLVYSNVQLFGKEDYVWYTKDFSFNELLEENYIPATALFKKKTWEEVGGYDETFIKGYEDWEFWLRLASKSFLGYKIDEVLFFYRKHEHSMLTESNKNRSELVNILKKKYSMYSTNSSIEIKLIIKNIYRYIKYMGKRLVSKFPHKFRVSLKKIYYSTRKSNELTNNGNFQKKFDEYKFEPVSFGNTTKINNIVIILPWLNIGGVERVYLELISKINIWFNVILITTKNSKHPWKKEFEKYTKFIYHLDLISKNQEDQLLFLMDLLNFYNVRLIQISNSLIGNQSIPLIKKYYPDIYICNHLHMEEPYEAWDYFKVSSEFKKDIDCFVVLTDRQKEILEKKYLVSSNKIYVIPNGIGTEWINGNKSKRNDQKLNLAFIGRVDEQKNPLFFIEVIRRLSKKSNYHKIDKVFLAGEGPLFRKCKKKIFSTKIKLLKGLNSNEVRRMLHEEIDILILPSIREGLPIIGLEAMASKVLLVVSNVDGWNDLLVNSKTGILIDDFDVELYAQKINEILEQYQVREKIIDSAQQQFMKDYTVDKMVDNYISLYCEVLQNN